MFERNDSLFALAYFIRPYSLNSIDNFLLLYSADNGASFNEMELNIPKGIALRESAISNKGQIIF